MTPGFLPESGLELRTFQLHCHHTGGDLKDFFLIATEEEQCTDDLYKDLEKLEDRIEKKLVECLFCGKVDFNDCFLEIQSGAGGTESNDWAMMLLRMYARWAQINHGFDVQIIDKMEGEEVGIKSATIKIKGDNAYGWIKTEIGVHRLVRISPFDANSKRHTSFAKIFASPDIKKDIKFKNAPYRNFQIVRLHFYFLKNKYCNFSLILNCNSIAVNRTWAERKKRKFT